MTPKQFHAVAGAFPHTEYATSYGHPASKAFGKFFTRLRTEDDSVVIGQISFEEREHLIAADPETFHYTDHYRNYPMVLARLSRIKPAELKLMLEKQWRHNAPKKWLKAWDLSGDVGQPEASKQTAKKKKTGTKETR